MKTNLSTPLSVFAAAALFAGCKPAQKQAAVSYLSSAAREGVVVKTVSATGTIEPEEIVDVGAQVSGKILEFGIGLDGKPLDYCSAVTNGMFLAKIDDVTYRADLDVAKAQLVRAKASVEVAEASLRSAEVKFNQAKREWERAEKIGVGIALSQTTYDQYRAAYETAEAAVGSAKAAVSQSQASVVEATASVEKAERNLSYCTIVSAVDGIILDRRVNIGQTVVSSMSASSLFLIARDLSRVQIWAAVNEADIGSLSVGTPVTFTVGTLPGRIFKGTVSRIRLNATITSNVVTYTVEISTDNSDGALLPFLTANILFETSRAEGGIVVPSKALRFRPEGETAKGPAVYVLGNDGKPVRKEVEVLLSNGLDASVKSAGLKVGDKVVTDVDKHPLAGDNGGSNPFMPSLPKPRKGGAPRR